MAHAAFKALLIAIHNGVTDRRLTRRLLLLRPKEKRKCTGGARSPWCKRRTCKQRNVDAPMQGAKRGTNCSRRLCEIVFGHEKFSSIGFPTFHYRMFIERKFERENVSERNKWFIFAKSSVLLFLLRLHLLFFLLTIFFKSSVKKIFLIHCDIPYYNK